MLAVLMLVVFLASAVAGAVPAPLMERPQVGPAIAFGSGDIVLAQVAPAKKVEAPSNAEKPTPPPKVEVVNDAKAKALAGKVQAFYENTRDFTADFQQKYRYRASARTQDSSGTVQVKKPGMMRWDYAKPYPKQFVLDGKALYMFDPEDNAVMVNREFSSDGLSAAVTFLWGRGSLTDEFNVAVVEKKSYGETVLALDPKTPQPGFTRLYFAIDAATGAVLTSVVIDSQGNENRITFRNVKTNQDLAAKRFEFKIPKGAQVQEF